MLFISSLKDLPLRANFQSHANVIIMRILPKNRRSHHYQTAEGVLPAGVPTTGLAAVTTPFVA